MKSAIRRVLLAFCCLLGGLTAVTVTEVVAPEPAGAVAQVCTGPGGVNGYFETWSNGIGYTVNCTVDYANGIHVRVDLCDQFGCQAANLDGWYGSQCDQLTFTGGSYPSTAFTITAQNNNPIGEGKGCAWHGVTFTAPQCSTWAYNAPWGNYRFNMMSAYGGFHGCSMDGVLNGFMDYKVKGLYGTPSGFHAAARLTTNCGTGGAGIYCKAIIALAGGLG